MAVVPTYSPQLAAAGMRSKVEAASTASNLPNFGVTLLDATSTGQGYTLDAPVIGVQKSIVMTAATTNAIVVHTNSTTVVFVGSTANSLSLDAVGEAVNLLGLSTASWFVTNNIGTVGLAASTGV